MKDQAQTMIRFGGTKLPFHCSADAFIRLGRFFYAIAIGFFGIEFLFYAGGATWPVPGPPWTPGRPLWACVSGMALIAAAVCIAIDKGARLPVILLGLGLFLDAILVYLPRLVANIHDPGPWTSGFEMLAICGGALALSQTLPAGSQTWEKDSSTVMTLGRFFFASLLIVVAVQHCIYAHFVATLVPSWIPGHLFWTYFVAGAFVASGLAIATQVLARLAATLLGLMFFLWVLILHAPRVAAKPHSGNEWTSAFVALAMSGSALIVARAATRTMRVT